MPHLKGMPCGSNIWASSILLIAFWSGLFWKGVIKDIESMVISLISHYIYMFLTQISTCDLCQRNSQKLSIATPELFPVLVHSCGH